MTVSESSLSNVGPGPDAISLAGLDAEFVVLVLHRDFFCSEDRQQVRRLKRRYEEFRTRDVEVVSVLPEGAEDATRWGKQYHVPFPVVADPAGRLGEAYGQSRRFGLFGRLHDVIGRMPATVVLDVRTDRPVEVFAHRGRSRTDRPAIDDVLEAVDRAAAETDAEAGTETAPEPGTEAREEAEAEMGGRSDAEAGTKAATDRGDDATRGPGPDRSLRVPPALDLPPDVWLRRAADDDVIPALRILQGALLEVGADRVREAIAASEVLVAEDDGFVVGALVLDESHVEAIAVRREHRGRGLGRALVETAAGDVRDPLTADFRAGVRGFWEELGFDVERRDGRLQGRRPA